MADESIFDLIEIPPGADLSQVERAVMDHVKQHIQSVAANYDDEQVRREEQYLRKIYSRFFDYALQWIRAEMTKHKDEKSAARAAILKNEARSVLASLQTNIVDFASCYMHLNRFMTLVRDEMKRDDMRIIDARKKIKWTSETGIMLGRHKKRKREILELQVKYTNAITLLSGIDQIWDALKADLLSVLGKDEAERHERSLRSALRGADYDRVKYVIRDFAEAKTKFSLDLKSNDNVIPSAQKKAKALAALVEENHAALISQDEKMFLRASEAQIALDAFAPELRKINAYIVKYNLPYMEYKLDHLHLLRDKLMVIGSLEGLMTLYIRLITGMARPLKDTNEIRSYESEVLDHIKWLQSSQFSEIEKIENEARKTVQEFREVRDEYQRELQGLLAVGESAEMIEGIAEA